MSGIECRAVIDPTRPTTQKNAFITNGYRLLKVDKLDNRPISEHEVNALKEQLTKHKVDVVVFSDFRHGISIRSQSRNSPRPYRRVRCAWPTARSPIAGATFSSSRIST